MCNKVYTFTDATFRTSSSHDFSTRNTNTRDFGIIIPSAHDSGICSTPFACVFAVRVTLDHIFCVLYNVFVSLLYDQHTLLIL